jgi:hypothetical protein
LLVTGHDHLYQRFVPLNGSGIPDLAAGVRQFVVGTGGTGLYTPTGTSPILDALDNSTHGVLKLDLSPGGYAWQFMPAGTGTYTDSGSDTCH